MALSSMLGSQSSYKIDHSHVSLTVSVGTAGSQDSLQQPKKRHRGIYSCTDCNSWFTEKRALVRHKKTQQHMKTVGLDFKRGFTCSVCNKSFTRDYDRRRHYQRAHSGALALAFENFDSWLLTNPQVVGVASQVPVVQDSWTTEPLFYLNAPASIIRSDSRGTDSSKGACSTSLQLEEPCSSSSTLVETSSCCKEAPSIKDSSYSSSTVLAEFHLLDSSNTNKSDLRRTKLRQKMLKLTSPIRHKISVFLAYGQIQTIPAFEPHTCTMCQQAFEKNENDLRMHLSCHLDEFYKRNGGYHCEFCDVNFTHEADLIMHHRSATNGYCGFHFSHSEPCTGHHPPTPPETNQSDWDALRYCVRLRHWEQAQLAAFRSRLDSLMRTRRPKDTDVYSIENAHPSPRTLGNGFLGKFRKCSSAPGNITCVSVNESISKLPPCTRGVDPKLEAMMMPLPADSRANRSLRLRHPKVYSKLVSDMKAYKGCRDWRSFPVFEDDDVDMSISADEAAHKKVFEYQQNLYRLGRWSQSSPELDRSTSVEGVE